LADPATSDAREVVSPCRNSCRYLPEAGLCGGCGRTLAEIEAWPTADAATRRVIVARSAARLAAMAMP
jgi:hypothetical protein